MRSYLHGGVCDLCSLVHIQLATLDLTFDDGPYFVQPEASVHPLIIITSQGLPAA